MKIRKNLRNWIEPVETICDWENLNKKYLWGDIFYKSIKKTQTYIPLEKCNSNETKNNDISDYFDKLEKLYNDSKKILELKVNWDGEGSPGYKQCTLTRAMEFLRNQAILAWYKMKKNIDIPEILEGPSGSIDILWDKENYELLLNVPPDIEKPLSFYGYDKNNEKDEIKGTIDKNIESFLLLLIGLSS